MNTPTSTWNRQDRLMKVGSIPQPESLLTKVMNYVKDLFKKEPVVASKNEGSPLLNDHARFLRRVAEDLEYITKEPRERLRLTPEDILVVKDLITRANYTALLFDDLIRRYQDHVPDYYNFTDEMDVVYDTMTEMVYGSDIHYKLSICGCVASNSSLQRIIKRYYTVPAQRSYWVRLFN